MFSDFGDRYSIYQACSVPFLYFLYRMVSSLNFISKLHCAEYKFAHIFLLWQKCVHCEHCESCHFLQMATIDSSGCCWERIPCSRNVDNAKYIFHCCCHCCYFIKIQKLSSNQNFCQMQHQCFSELAACKNLRFAPGAKYQCNVGQKQKSDEIWQARVLSLPAP